MSLIFWKIYFWITVGLLALGILGEVGMPSGKWVLFLFDATLIAGTCFALYGFIYKKMFLTPAFWKHFLSFNISYTILYLLYAFFPKAPIIEHLAVLSYSNDNLLAYAIFGTIFSLPSYYAFYRLSQEQFYTPKEVMKKDGVPKWNMVQIALWGYASVMTAIFFVLSFFPSGPSETSGNGDISQSFYGVAIVAPVLLFWLWIALEYKQYKWNWWRITLVLNSILYSGLMVIGLLFSDMLAGFAEEGTEIVAESSFDIIATLQFLIIFIALQVFGREQFRAPQKPLEKEKPPKETA